jgi:hypothetical protein
MVSHPGYGAVVGFLGGLGIVSALMFYAAPLTSAERAVRLPHWAGCYELALGSFPGNWDIPALPFAPPPHFRLDTAVQQSPRGISLGFMTASPESPNARYPIVFPPGWDLLGRDSAIVFWGDGFIGIELRIPDGYGSRTGVAQITTDMLDANPPRASVRIVPIRCGT